MHTLGPASRPHEPRVASTPENCEEDEDDEEEEAKEEDKAEEENVEPLTLLTLLTLLLLLRTNTQTHIQTHTNTYTHNIAAAGAEDADEDVCTTTASGPQRHVSQSPVRQRAAGEGTSLSRWGQRAACKGTSLSRWSCGQDELWLWLWLRLRLRLRLWLWPGQSGARESGGLRARERAGVKPCV